jgi:Ankyrin repeats (many copies)
MGADSHPQSHDSAHEEQEDSDDEPFVYPDSSNPHTEDVPAHPVGPVEEPAAPTVISAPAPVTRPAASPEQLEEIYSAAAAGDLFLLQTLFQSALASGDLEAFALANSATSRTGLTPLHAAASRGYSEIVQWRTYATANG